MDKSEINHFNDFVAFLKAQTVLSDSFRDSLILRLNAAMADAYDRGKQDGYERAARKGAMEILSAEEVLVEFEADCSTKGNPILAERMKASFWRDGKMPPAVLTILKLKPVTMYQRFAPSPTSGANRTGIQNHANLINRTILGR